MKLFILWKKGEKFYYILCTLNKVLNRIIFYLKVNCMYILCIYKMFEIMKYCCYNSYDFE